MLMKRLFAVALILIFFSGLHRTFSQSWIRINQLGYTPHSVKVAVLVSKENIHPGSFGLYNALTGDKVYTSQKMTSYGAYGPFASTFRLNFSDFKTEGSYVIRAGDVQSPVFRISNDVYDGTADFLLRYMRQQRCGFNPFLNDSCHTRDGYIIYNPGKDSAFIDVVGGWHDATDYLQYVATSANAVFQMLFAWKQNPSAFGDAFDSNGRPGKNGIPDILDEARWGLNWLLKMNPDSGEMYNQVADDRDHIGFRSPVGDTANYGIGTERPVYFCTGKPQGVFKYKSRATGIASTAGKYASAFALGAETWATLDPSFANRLKVKARQAFWFGVNHPGACQTAPCTAPYFYEEDNWTDDMELAAAELYQLTGDSRYLEASADYGRQEKTTPWMGADTARHYQWYPFFNMGHYVISGEVSGMDGNKQPGAGNIQSSKTSVGNIGTGYAREFLEYWREGIDKVYRRGMNNPFLNGIPFIWCSNNLTVAMVSQCHLYQQKSGDSTYAEMEAALRDWLFGCNPWGTSMVVGLPAWGDYPSDPHSSLSHLFHYTLDGGLVDGPVYASIYNNLKGIYLANGDPYNGFQSHVAVYHDDYADYSTNEPTMDGTADFTYYLSALQSEAHQGTRVPVVTDHGAIIRGDCSKKQICLVFTGHEFADGLGVVIKVLDKHKVKAAFFLTGDFYRNPAFAKMVVRLKKDGHYLGAHSDKHLLYCDWGKRDSLLVSRSQFAEDMMSNYAAMKQAGAVSEGIQYFLPPYEWYNDSIAAWSKALGLKMVNFTPGTSSNQDWTYPQLGNKYISSKDIYNRILGFDKSQPVGLNGFILLTHFGTDTRRTDKFYDQLDKLLTELEKRGYGFISLQQMVH